MSIFKDLYYTNKKGIKQTSNLLVKNWPIIFTGLVYSVISIILMFIITLFLSSFILRFFTGIILFIAISAIISNYLYLLYNVVKVGKVTIQDFKDGFKAYLRKVYTIFFIGWIAGLVYGMFIMPILQNLLSGVVGARALNAIGSILLLIFLNPLPETVYQKHYSPMESIKYAFEFVKENWIEWFLPNVILLGALYLTTGTIITNVFVYNIGFNFDFSLPNVLIYMLGQIIFSFTMIYRGILFNILSTSTRRKRLFMRNLYK